MLNIDDKGNIMELNVERIEAHRIVLNEKPRQFAARIGMSHQWYYDLINGGKANVRLDTINKIAASLEVKPKDLIK